MDGHNAPVGDIEFLDTADPVPPADPSVAAATDGSSARGRPVGRAVVAALLLLAAALCVVASFRTVYEFRLRGDSFGYRASVDGWGRLRIDLRQRLGRTHGTRFGVGLVTGAGVLVLAAVLRLLPGPRPRRAWFVTAVGGVGLLVGVIGSTLLELQGQYDNLREQISASADGAARQRLDYSVGWFSWLGLVAVGCALIALAVPTVARRRPRPESDVVADAPDPPPHPSDEPLDAPQPPAG